MPRILSVGTLLTVTALSRSYSKVDLPSTEVEEVDALAGDEGEDRPTPLAEEEGEDDQADSPVAFPLRETQHS